MGVMGLGSWGCSVPMGPWDTGMTSTYVSWAAVQCAASAHPETPILNWEAGLSSWHNPETNVQGRDATPL